MPDKVFKRSDMKRGRGPRRPGVGGKARRDTILDIVEQATTGKRRNNQSTDNSQ